MMYELKPGLRIHRAFFADGAVIEVYCSRKQWRQHVDLYLSSMPDYIFRKVWFRPCQAWTEATKRSEEIIRERYNRDPFIRIISELWEDDDDSE